MSSRPSKTHRNKNHRRNQKRANPATHMTKRNLKIHGVPDEWVETFTYNISPANDVGISSTGGAVNYYMNSMQNYLSGQAIQAAYYNGIASNYERGRVIKSRVRVTVSSRETSKYINVVVVPISASSTLNSPASWAQLSSLPYARTYRLSPVGSGQTTHIFSQTINPAKLIGDHYNTQDEYAFTVGADPATLVYWLVGQYNPDGNTATTGGIQVSLVVTNTVKFYQPDRDNSVTLRFNDNFESMQKAQTRLLTLMKAASH